MSKIVLITGATSGIGKATAFGFAKEQYTLILCGRRLQRLQELKSTIEDSYDCSVTLLSFDIRNKQSVTDAIDSLPTHLREIEILVNNAGLALGYDDFHNADTDHWDTMIDTNVKGLLYISRLISPGMVDRNKGHIINICSTAGHEVYPKGNVYCATKHAVDAITNAMRLDLHTHNIKVSQVSPAHVEETEFAITRFEGDQEKAQIYSDFNPLKSQDVADIIVFMATRPAHVNIQDVLVMGTQQASSVFINRSGRLFD
jgi:NADP-dependent 3-hydroxy acid dehydrogenase YdfG